MDATIADWLASLEQRHLANLRIPEVTKALRALSSAYVERRVRPSSEHGQRVRGALDSAGKRAAFALFYAPLHFLTVSRIVNALEAEVSPPPSIVDVGCGTGAAGAAWALAAGGASVVTGIDRHPWALDEARWTYRQLGLHGHARVGDVLRLPHTRGLDAIVAAYTLNELADGARVAVEDTLLAAAARGTRVLIVEPIARGITPWWEGTSTRVRAAGGRADEWRFALDRPPLIALFDKAAGLDHRELTARSLYLAGPPERVATST